MKYRHAKRFKTDLKIVEPVIISIVDILEYEHKVNEYLNYTNFHLYLANTKDHAYHILGLLPKPFSFDIFTYRMPIKKSAKDIAEAFSTVSIAEVFGRLKKSIDAILPIEMVLDDKGELYEGHFRLSE